MKIGLPQGLLYYKYSPFFETFFEALGAKLIISDNTNKQIIDAGINCCTNEACFPIKIFHGHVDSIKKQCDLILVPRIMKVDRDEYICPHLCSIPEMIIHSLENLPEVIHKPIYFNSRKKLHYWARELGNQLSIRKSKVDDAFNQALLSQSNYKNYFNQNQYKNKILLLGHGYLVYDSFLNMNLIKKLNSLDIGVITVDSIDKRVINHTINKLPKEPFWSFYKQAYNSSLYLSNQNLIDGIIFLSCFSCGIDTIIMEVIKEDFPNIPLLSLKLDEHTGDAGIDTRIEAFSDMIKLSYLKGAVL